MTTTNSLTSALDRMHERPDGLYGKFEEVPAISQAGHYRRIQLLERLNIGDPSDMTCLDFGMGAWGFASMYPKLHRCSKAVGMDISQAAVEMSVKVANDNHHPYADRFSVFQSDGMELPLPDESVDLVLSGESIEHTRFPRRFLSECHRVLKARGQMVITTPNRDALLYKLTGEDYCTSPEHFWLFNYAEVVEVISEFFEIEECYGYNGTVGPELDRAFNNKILAERWSAAFEDQPDLASSLIFRVRKRDNISGRYTIEDIPSDKIAYPPNVRFVPLEFELKGALLGPGDQVQFTRPPSDGLVCRMWSHRWSGFAEIVTPAGSEKFDLYSYVPGWKNWTSQRKNIAPEEITIRYTGDKNVLSENNEVIFFEAFTYKKIPLTKPVVKARPVAPAVVAPKVSPEAGDSRLKLMRPGREYFRYVPFVGTTFFHWFTPTTGNLRGHWPPPGGRALWSGDVEFWMGQIKQVMMANIDALYVHLVDVFEPERLNFFRALQQLRQMGWDVPKIAPFFDTFYTYREGPVDVATRSGKDEFVSHYVRFFEQYLSICDDPVAASYLLRMDGKPVLTSWWTTNLLHNVEQLSRADVEKRLISALGERLPALKNGIYMMSTASIDPDYSFSDERIVMYSGYAYGIHSVHQGIDVWHVQPGYWDQNIRKPGYFLPRDGGKHYRSAWEAVVAALPYVHRVYVESWNEYEEGSAICAADPTHPFREPGMHVTNTDTFSSENDPFEYIRTTALGAGMVNQRPLNDAIFLAVEAPVEAAAGSEITLAVVVRNEGNASWSGASGYALQIDPAGTYSIDDSENDIVLYEGIFRGRTVTFVPTINVPEQAGSWQVVLQMTANGTPFGQEQTITIRVSENVAAPSISPAELQETARRLNANFMDPGEAALLAAKHRSPDNQAEQHQHGEEAMHRTPVEVELLRAESGRLAMQVSQQKEEINRLRRTISGKGTTEGLEITKLRQMLSEREATLADVLNSRSWKLTSPLRKVASSLRKG